MYRIMKLEFQVAATADISDVVEFALKSKQTVVSCCDQLFLVPGV